MIRRSLLLVVLICLNFTFINAQSNKYWIFFKDKDTSNYDCSKSLSKEAIRNRNEKGIALNQFSDIAPNSNYINKIKSSLNIQVLCTSKWLNAVSVFMSPSQKEQVEAYSFVKDVRLIDRNIVVSSTQIEVNPEYMHIAMIQMGLRDIIDAGLDGKGVNVGVIDAGFFMAQSDRYTSHLVTEGKIKVQRDFIDRKSVV